MNKKLIRSFIYSIIICLLLILFYQQYARKDSVFRSLSIADPVKVDPSRNIIINAVPKSASEYIASKLEKSLGYTRKRISSEYIPRDQVIYAALREFYSSGGNITKQHLDATALNINILKRYTNKIVLHVRDPREVLLSWVHHLNQIKMEGMDLYYFDPEPPQEYYALSLNEQIDWNIENFLPNIVKWINDWVSLKDSEDLKPNGFKILLTKYDDFYSDEDQFYAKILDFYAIPTTKFKTAAINKARNVHFREGKIGTWRSVYTEQQKQKIANIVPDELLQRFNWP